MSYTKGEWKAYLIEKPDKWMVCSGKSGIDGVAKMVDENQKANANLIAAAPDLYEALLAFDEYTKTNYPANIRLKQIAVEKMDAVLAKAEGK